MARALTQNVRGIGFDPHLGTILFSHKDVQGENYIYFQKLPSFVKILDSLYNSYIAIHKCVI